MDCQIQLNLLLKNLSFLYKANIYLFILKVSNGLMNFDDTLKQTIVSSLRFNRFYNATIFNPIRIRDFGGLNSFLFLNKSQWFDFKNLEALQLKKLKARIFDAYQNSPFYRDLMKKNGLRPEDIKKLGDLQKLPIISKKDLKKLPLNKYISMNARLFKLFIQTTSGSTGTPFKIFTHKESVSWKNAALFRSLEYINNDPFKDRMLSLGFAFGYLSYSNPLDVMKGILHWSKIKFEDKDFKEFHSIVKAFKPHLIYSTYSMIFRLATIARKYFDKYTLPKIITTGEPLFNRKFLEKVFETQIFSQYGANETGPIGHDCIEQKGLHVNMENMIVETAQNGQAVANEKGEILITDLTNFVTPIIRYNLYDLAELETDKCACGRQSTRIKKLYGRNLDELITPDGGVINPDHIHYCFSFFSKWIDLFQIIQKDRDSIIVKLKVNNLYNSKIEEQLIKKLEFFTKSQFRIKIRKVNKLNLKGRGKFRYIKSYLKKSF